MESVARDHVELVAGESGASGEGMRSEEVESRRFLLQKELENVKAGLQRIKDMGSDGMQTVHDLHWEMFTEMCRENKMKLRPENVLRDGELRRMVLETQCPICQEEFS